MTSSTRSSTSTSNNWIVTGTGLGVNGSSGFTGNLLDLQVNGVRKFNVDWTGLASGVSVTASADITTSAGRFLQTGTSAGANQFTEATAFFAPTVYEPLGTATNVTNFNSGNPEWFGSYWTGSAAANDAWSAQLVMGAGVNPSSTLMFAKPGGSTGAANVSLSGLMVPTGNIATWTPAAGFTVACADLSGASITCTSTRGSLVIVSTGTASSGTLAAASWAPEPSARVCQFIQNRSSTTAIGLNHGAPTNGGVVLTTPTGYVPFTYYVDYICL